MSDMKLSEKLTLIRSTSPMHVGNLYEPLIEQAKALEDRAEELENTLDLLDPECDRYNLEEEDA